jgi:hypothetical protein
MVVVSVGRGSSGMGVAAGVNSWTGVGVSGAPVGESSVFGSIPAFEHPSRSEDRAAAPPRAVARRRNSLRLKDELEPSLAIKFFLPINSYPINQQVFYQSRSSLAFTPGKKSFAGLS